MPTFGGVLLSISVRNPSRVTPLLQWRLSRFSRETFPFFWRMESVPSAFLLRVEGDDIHGHLGGFFSIFLVR